MTEENKKQITGAKYIGGNKFLVGVPARDLTAEEWLSFSAKERKHFIRLGLYEVTYD